MADSQYELSISPIKLIIRNANNSIVIFFVVFDAAERRRRALKRPKKIPIIK